MIKRCMSLLIICCLLATMIALPAVKAESRASNYITNYYAILSPGDGSGNLEIEYHITAGVTGITRIGVLAIFVYRTDGTLAKTIIGSTSNGMVKSSGTTVVGVRNFTLNPGETYYCSVRFIVENANGNDTRSYTTNTVVAPR